MLAVLSRGIVQHLISRLLVSSRVARGDSSELRCTLAQGLRGFLAGLGVANVFKELGIGRSTFRACASGSLEKASTIRSDGVDNALSDTRFVSSLAGNVEWLEGFHEPSVLLISRVVVRFSPSSTQDILLKNLLESSCGRFRKLGDVLGGLKPRVRIGENES